MNATEIMNIIGASLGLAAKLLGMIGDVVNQKRVEDILRDGGFPGFPSRAEAVGEKIRDRFERGSGAPE